MKWILWVSALSIEISSFLIFFYEQSYDKSLVFLCCCLMMSKWKRFGCCIFMNCCRRLDELLGRDSWNSWDVDFLAAAGITWTLQQCAQQGCSHQLQEKAFSQFRAGGQSFPSVTLLCTSTPCVTGIWGWWRAGDSWCQRCDCGWGSEQWSFSWGALFALEGAAEGSSDSFRTPSMDESLMLQHKSFFSFFPVWSYFPISIMRWSPRDFSCIIQRQKYSPFLL